MLSTTAEALREEEIKKREEEEEDNMEQCCRIKAKCTFISRREEEAFNEITEASEGAKACNVKCVIYLFIGSFDRDSAIILKWFRKKKLSFFKKYNSMH